MVYINWEREREEGGKHLERMWSVEEGGLKNYTLRIIKYYIIEKYLLQLIF